jgi:hypothetical protein
MSTTATPPAPPAPSASPAVAATAPAPLPATYADLVEHLRGLKSEIQRKMVELYQALEQVKTQDLWRAAEGYHSFEDWLGDVIGLSPVWYANTGEAIRRLGAPWVEKYGRDSAIKVIKAQQQTSIDRILRAIDDRETQLGRPPATHTIDRIVREIVGPPKKFNEPTENDRLRAAVAELEAQVQALRAENAALHERLRAAGL